MRFIGGHVFWMRLAAALGRCSFKSMCVSLEQAIEIHARTLVFRQRRNAPRAAEDRAVMLQKLGDLEGFEVWLKVAEVAAQLLDRDGLAVAEEGAADASSSWRLERTNS